MKSTKTGTTLLAAALLTVTLVLASPSAIADDVDECVTSPADAVQVCVEDWTAETDGECEAGQAGEWYYGTTEVSVATETDVGSTDTSAQGTEWCYEGQTDEDVSVSHDTCLFPEGWSCGQNADVSVLWQTDERGNSTYMKIDGDAADLKIRWSDRFGCDISVSSFNPEWISERVPCPAGLAPPAPPVNPGWGNVTPSSP